MEAKSESRLTLCSNIRNDRRRKCIWHRHTIGLESTSCWHQPIKFFGDFQKDTEDISFLFVLCLEHCKAPSKCSDTLRSYIDSPTHHYHIAVQYFIVTVLFRWSFCHHHHPIMTVLLPSSSLSCHDSPAVIIITILSWQSFCHHHHHPVMTVLL